jgi:hypothetical protein
MVTVRRLERERYLLALASNRLASPKAVMTTPPRLNVARSDTPASNSTQSDRRILPTVHNRHRVARKPVAREAPAKLEQRLSASPATSALSRIVLEKKSSRPPKK